MLWGVLDETLLLAKERELPQYEEEGLLRKLRRRRDTESCMLWGVLGKTVLLAEERQMLRFQTETPLRELYRYVSCCGTAGDCNTVRQRVGTNCCMHPGLFVDAIEQSCSHRVVLWP